MKGMEEFLGISYKLEKSENFEEYMKALGVGLVNRKMGNAMIPTVTLASDNEKYKLTTSTTFKSHVIIFKLDQEFDEETLDGRKVKSIITFKENKMIHTQRSPGGEVITTIIREFTPQEMKTVLTAGDVVSTRVYYKVD